MNETYVVTGDRGFVGSRLRRHLLARGDKVIGVDRVAVSAEATPHYRPLVVDLSNREEVLEHAEVFRMARAVFHLAAKLSATDNDPLEPHLEANLRSVENLFEAVDGANVPVILSSTMSVYGLPPRSIPVAEDQIPRPTEAYGLSKLAAECTAERLARAGRVPCAALRYSGIFGPGYSYGAIHLYVSKALNNEVISVYGGGRTVRDYVHVEDVVAANLLAAEAALRLGWGLYHIGGGEPMRLVDLAKLSVEIVGQGRVETNDRPAPFDFAFDISHARNDLGYAPQPLKDRIAQYVAEYRKTISVAGK